MPKRPPRKWMKHCIKGVEKSGYADDPGAVCGNTWYNVMSESERRSAVREAERKKRKHKKKY